MEASVEVHYGTGTIIGASAAGHRAGTAPADTNACQHHPLWFHYFGLSGRSIDPDRQKREISYHIQIKLTGQTGGFTHGASRM